MDIYLAQLMVPTQLTLIPRFVIFTEWNITKLLASDSGTVTTATNHWSYGNYIEIDHVNGYTTLYAHNNSLLVGVVNLLGSDSEKVEVCMEYKKFMFETLHEQLPDAKFIVLSGLLLPGRSDYTALTQEINRELELLCSEYDYMYFIDASEMTFDGNNYSIEMFISDGIHLNRDGQLAWCNNYIRPQIEAVIDEHGFEHLRQ